MNSTTGRIGIIHAHDGPEDPPHTDYPAGVRSTASFAAHSVGSPCVAVAVGTPP